MKLKIKYITLLALLFAVSACNDSDEYAGDPTTVFDRPKFDTSTPEGAKIKEIYDQYGLYIQTDVKAEDYWYDYSTIASYCTDPATIGGYRVVPCKPSNVMPILNNIKTKVFDVLPKELIKKYMPINIFLTDSSGYNTSLYPLEEYRFCLQYGTMNTNNLFLSSCVNKSFKTTDTKLDLSQIQDTRDYAMRMLALFVERMMVNMPLPEKYAAIFDAASKEGNANNTTTTPSTSAVTNIRKADNDPDTKNYIRYGFVMNGRNWTNIDGPFPAPKIKEDFAQYVAFIVYMPDHVKKTFYSRRFNPNFPNRINEKENLVRNYFKSLKITLPYIPISDPSDPIKPQP